jgi:hypothetical protein
MGVYVIRFTALLWFQICKHKNGKRQIKRNSDEILEERKTRNFESTKKKGKNRKKAVLQLSNSGSGSNGKKEARGVDACAYPPLLTPSRAV